MTIKCMCMINDELDEMNDEEAKEVMERLQKMLSDSDKEDNEPTDSKCPKQCKCKCCSESAETEDDLEDFDEFDDLDEFSGLLVPNELPASCLKTVEDIECAQLGHKTQKLLVDIYDTIITKANPYKLNQKVMYSADAYIEDEVLEFIIDTLTENGYEVSTLMDNMTLEITW